MNAPIDVRDPTHVATLASELKHIVGPDGVLERESEKRPYECDGLTAYRQIPLLVVLPRTTAEVQGVLQLCAKRGVKIVPRGSGTSLSGGALPVADGIVMTTARMSRILAIDAQNRTARIQPGVANLHISESVAHLGLCYMPDPSSQAIASIGGNVSENSGGVHCLKYGVTSAHIISLEVVLMGGDVIRIGGDVPGTLDGEYDLMGLMTGGEGLLGFVTEVVVKLAPKPSTARVVSLGFPSVDQASKTVGAIIAAGIIPAGLEFMDRKVLDAVASMLGDAHAPEVEAVLLCELDGHHEEVDELIVIVEDVSKKNGAIEVQVSKSEEDREKIWKGRKAAFGAIGKIARDYYCTDGTIPRSKLSEVLSRMADLSKKHGLDYANCFHAGDGNLHPIIMYDAGKPGDLEKAEQFGADILKACVDVGGVLSGEHGIGIEKKGLMTYQFSDIDMRQQQRIKCAFDPMELLNPGKVFPTPCRCAEMGRMHVHDGKTRFQDIPRF